MTEALPFNTSSLNFSGFDNIDIETLSRTSDRIGIINPIVVGVLLGIGILGNLLVFYVTVSPSTKRLKKRPIHSLFVLNLATADIIYLLSSGPFQVVSFSLSGWRFGRALCPIFNFMKIWTMSVSIFTMCALASIRFCGLVAPFRFKNSFIVRSGKMTIFFLLSILWLTGAVLASPNLVYFGIIKRGESLQCAWSNVKTHDVYWIILVTLTYVIPFILVTVLYIFITVQIRFFMQRKDCVFNGVVEHSHNEKRQLTVMVFGLILAFLICWFPIHLYTLIQVSRLYTDPFHARWRIILQLMGDCFSYAHACVNPAIYTFAAPGFRCGIKKVIRNSCRKKTFTFKRNSTSGYSSTKITTTTKLTNLSNDPEVKHKLSTTLNSLPEKQRKSTDPIIQTAVVTIETKRYRKRELKT